MSGYMTIGQVTENLGLTRSLPYIQLELIRPYHDGFPLSFLDANSKTRGRVCQVIRTDRQPKQVHIVTGTDISTQADMLEVDVYEGGLGLDYAVGQKLREFKASDDWKNLEAGIPVVKLLLAAEIVNQAKKEIESFDVAVGSFPVFAPSRKSTPYSGDDSFTVGTRHTAPNVAVALNPRELGDFPGLDEIIRESVI